MPTYKVTAPDGRIVKLTGDSPPTDDELTQIFAGLPKTGPRVANTATGGGLGIAAGAQAVPLFQRIAEEAATNPAMKRFGAGVGQVVGGLGALARTYNPLEAAGGAWLGGRMGWHTGALAQKLAAPVATGLGKLMPIAQAINPVGAAAGVGELAQMADPTRRDIGFMGISRTPPPVPGQQPALLNLLLSKITGQ